MHRGAKACRDLKTLPNGTKLKKLRIFCAHIKPGVNEITGKKSQAAEPKYYNNAFFWGQHHPALATACPGRQHLLLWALQREKTPLWWGQSSPLDLPFFPREGKASPKRCCAALAQVMFPMALLRICPWCSTGQGMGSETPWRCWGFPKLLQPHRGPKCRGSPCVLTLSHVHQVAVESWRDEGHGELLEVPLQGIRQRLGLVQVHVHSRGICRERGRGNPEPVVLPLWHRALGSSIPVGLPPDMEDFFARAPISAVWQGMISLPPLPQQIFLSQFPLTLSSTCPRRAQGSISALCELYIQCMGQGVSPSHWAPTAG